MNHPRAIPSMPPTPALPPEAQREVDHLRAQFRAMGMTDAEIEDDPVTDVTPEEHRAFLAGRAPCPWPR